MILLLRILNGAFLILIQLHQEYQLIILSSIMENTGLIMIDKIGFTDLMNGGLSDACSRVDWIEVYANPVKR